MAEIFSDPAADSSPLQWIVAGPVDPPGVHWPVVCDEVRSPTVPNLNDYVYTNVNITYSETYIFDEIPVYYYARILCWMYGACYAGGSPFVTPSGTCTVRVENVYSEHYVDVDMSALGWYSATLAGYFEVPADVCVPVIRYQKRSGENHFVMYATYLGIEYLESDTAAYFRHCQQH